MSRRSRVLNRRNTKKYFEDLKGGSNKEIEPKDNFEKASRGEHR
jgi:hypothetical protein